MNDTMPSVDAEYIPPGALESISRAEIDIAISTARKYPQHSPDKLAMVKQNMLSFATLDVETAEACFYSLPRGGKLIQGPSVRLAEIAVACYGNLRAGTRIIDTVTDGQDPHVVIQAVAMDLEKNIQVSIEKRRRIVKKKSKPTIDEDDINLATNACSAIAFRDSVYKVIPLALIKPVYEAAKKVAVGDQKTLAERRTRCMETFAKMGLQKERVLSKLEKKTIEEINLEDLELLIGLYTAVKDGEVQIDEAFPPFPPIQTDDKTKPAQTAHEKATKGSKSEPSRAPQTSQDKPKASEATSTPAASETPANQPAATEAKAPEQTLAPDPAKSVTETGPKPETTGDKPQDDDNVIFETVPSPTAHEVPGFVPNPQETAELQAVRRLLHSHNKSEADLISVLRKNKAMKDEQTKISELSTKKLENIAAHWEGLMKLMAQPA